jgi:hypothetical protein
MSCGGNTKIVDFFSAAAAAAAAELSQGQQRTLAIGLKLIDQPRLNLNVVLWHWFAALRRRFLCSALRFFLASGRTVRRVTATPFSVPCDDMKRPLRIVWGLAIAIALADCLWLPLAGFHAAPGPLLRLAAIFAGLCALWWVYARRRPDAAIAALAEAAAFLVFFTLSLELFSYFSMALALPLRDSVIAAADQALGFDFPAHLAYVAARPRFARVLEFAYNTSMIQIAVTVIALTATQRLACLRRALCVDGERRHRDRRALSDPWPLCLFPYSRRAPAGVQRSPHRLAVRAPCSCFGDGFHADVAAQQSARPCCVPVLPYGAGADHALGPIADPAVAVPLFVVNGLLIFGALSNGDHYLCDLIGGAAVALATLAAVTGGLALRCQASAPPWLGEPFPAE